MPSIESSCSTLRITGVEIDVFGVLAFEGRLRVTLFAARFATINNGSNVLPRNRVLRNRAIFRGRLRAETPTR